VIFYLTYNDQPSGVYWSQVTDVVAYLNGLGHGRVRLVALVSVQGWRTSRRRIKEHAPDAIVLPMVPRMRNWRWNLVWLLLFCAVYRPSGIMARGVMATWMALRARDRGLVRRVCFDGRGAYAAEWEEYRIIDDDALIGQFRPLEQEAVQRSDIRLAVSQALVAHWGERYRYHGQDHVVIPCTLAARDGSNVPIKARSDARIRLVYSGSAAGWQSFQLLEALLVPLLTDDARVHVLFLSPPDPQVDALGLRYPGRVEQTWVDAAKVADILAEQDLGILLREDTITNRVSSPTKFAEYLAAGLPVMISNAIGDFSKAVRTHGLGVVVAEGEPLNLAGPTSIAERERVRAYAAQHFTKDVYRTSYARILRVLGERP
jgi:hypothetical protein